MKRPSIRAKFPELTDDATARFVSALLTYGISIGDVPQLFSYPRDPKDEPYVNLAFAANAGYLVSWDEDLLALNDTLGSALRVVTPVAFLFELRRKLGRA